MSRAWYLAWLAYGSLAIAAIVLCGLLRFPSDWDSRAYHIPFIDVWLRARTLWTTDSSSWFHPGNNEVMGLWCAAPFSGDFLVALNNVPAVAVLGLGARELATRVACRRSIGELAGLAVLTPHVVTRQLLDCENDVAVAGFFIAALAYGVRFSVAPRKCNTVLLAISVGILPGIKYYALGYAAIAGLTATLLTLRLGGPGRIVALLAAGGAGVVTFSGHWYLRNWLLTGSPIFPQGFLGVPGVLAETFPHIRQTSLLGHRDASDIPFVVRAIWMSLGPAHGIACLASPVTTAFLIARGFRQPADRSARLSAILAIACLLGVGVFAITPFVVEARPGTRDMLKEGYLPARFLLPTATLMVIALLVSLTHLQQSPQWAAAPNGRLPRGRCLVYRRYLGAFKKAAFATFGALALAQLYPGRFSPLPADAVTVSLAGVDFLLAVLVGVELCRMSQGNIAKRLLFGACCISLLVGTAWLSSRWHAGFAEFYGRRYRTRLFEKLEGLSASNVRICALMYCSYPFFGSQRQFAVVAPVWAPNYEALREYLLRQAPDLVVTSMSEPAGGHRYDEMQGWLAGSADLCELVYSEELFCLYRFLGAKRVKAAK